MPVRLMIAYAMIAGLLLVIAPLLWLRLTWARRVRRGRDARINVALKK